MSRANYVRKKFYSIYRDLNRQTYEAEKRRLQAELLKLQHWAVENKKRVAITFDGRDAAGKGTIKRFTEYLMPHHSRVVELGVPTKKESRWFRRYEQQMSRWEIVFYRSWYNRALIDRPWATARSGSIVTIKRVSLGGKLIANDLILISFTSRWIAIRNCSGSRTYSAPAQILEIFQERRTRPGQVGGVHQVQDRCSRAPPPESPWVVINANDKMYARLACMLYTIYHIPYIERQTFKPLSGEELPSKYRIEIDGVPFSNLSFRQYSILERMTRQR